MSSGKEIVSLPPKLDDKPILVLDLDHTLIYKLDDFGGKREVAERKHLADFTIPSDFEDMYVIMRPFVHEFLRTLVKKYEIGVFTTGSEYYANEIVKHLNTDQTISWIVSRNSYRMESQTPNGGMLVKDLERLPRDLSKMVLIDNFPQSMQFQPSNGILCIPYGGEPEDSELQFLQEFLLETLDFDDDFREQLHKLNQRDDRMNDRYSYWRQELARGAEEDAKPRWGRSARRLRKVHKVLDIVDWRGDTILHRLIKEDDVDTALWLLEQDGLEFDVNMQDANGKTILHLAVEKSLTALTNSIIRKTTPTFDIEDEDGQTVSSLVKSFPKNCEMYRLIFGHQ